MKTRLFYWHHGVRFFLVDEWHSLRASSRIEARNMVELVSSYRRWPPVRPTDVPSGSKTGSAFGMHCRNPDSKAGVSLSSPKRSRCRRLWAAPLPVAACVTRCSTIDDPRDGDLCEASAVAQKTAVGVGPGNVSQLSSGSWSVNLLGGSSFRTCPIAARASVNLEAVQKSVAKRHSRTRPSAATRSPPAHKRTATPPPTAPARTPRPPRRSSNPIDPPPDAEKNRDAPYPARPPSRRQQVGLLRIVRKKFRRHIILVRQEEFSHRLGRGHSPFGPGITRPSNSASTAGRLE